MQKFNYLNPNYEISPEEHNFLNFVYFWDRLQAHWLEMALLGEFEPPAAKYANIILSKNARGFSDLFGKPKFCLAWQVFVSFFSL